MQNDLSFFSQEELTNKFNDAWQELITYTNSIPQENKTAYVYPHKDGYDYEILGKVCGKMHFSKGLFFDKQGIE